MSNASTSMFPSWMLLLPFFVPSCRPCTRDAPCDEQCAGAVGEDDGMNYAGHMVAGACAGVAEHTFMYPVDLVKTRMQVRNPAVLEGGSMGACVWIR